MKTKWLKTSLPRGDEIGSVATGSAVGDIVGATLVTILEGIVALGVETTNGGLMSSSSFIEANPKDLRSSSAM